MIVGKKWKPYLDESGIKRIEEAISQVEKHTWGEVIPIVARRSTGVGHVRSVVGLILLLASLLIFKFSLWTTFVALLCFMIAIPISNWHWVQRLLVHPDDQEFEVFERAELEFYRGQYSKTEHRTAIVLFVSLMERQVVVLADRAINDKVGKEQWNQASRLITEQLRQKNLAEGMVRAIEYCGKILAEHFPASHENPNEISNHLKLLDR